MALEGYQPLADSISQSTMFTAFDWIVGGVVGLSALLALFRGFVREVLSLATWVGAAIATLHLYQPVKEMLTPHIEQSLVVMGLASVGTYITFLIIFSIISTMIIRFLRAGADIGILDSIMGMLFGMARGLFIVSLCYLILTTIMTKDQYPEWIARAKLLPHVENTAKFIVQLAPEYVNEMSELSDKAQETGETLRKAKEASDIMEKNKGSSRSNEDIEKLLESLQKENVDR